MNTTIYGTNFMKNIFYLKNLFFSESNNKRATGKDCRHSQRLGNRLNIKNLSEY